MVTNKLDRINKGQAMGVVVCSAELLMFPSTAKHTLHQSSRTPQRVSCFITFVTSALTGQLTMTVTNSEFRNVYKCLLLSLRRNLPSFGGVTQ